MSAQILEAIIYRAKPGVSPEEALRKVETVVDPALHQGTGLERIWRSRTPDGTFVDTLLWKDAAALAAVKKKAQADPAIGAVFALFEESSLTMVQAQVISQDRS